MILLLTGIVAVASAVPYVDQFSPVEFTTEMLVFSVLFGGLLGAVTIWVASTTIVYVLSALAGGSGPLSRVAANIGWALLPLLLMNAVKTTSSWILALVGGPATVTPTQMQLPFWMVAFNAIVGVAGYLWIGYLLTYAIRDARNLAVWRSALIAGLVVLVPVLNSLTSLL